MAKGRNNNKLTKFKKIEPAVKRMTFVLPTGVSYIDLALCASIVNRRGYSQQWKVPVSGMEIFTSTPGAFSIHKLPDTWVMDNAYHKSRAMWDKMNDQVLDEEPSIRGAYADFKIYMDAGMELESIQDSLNPDGRILTPADEFGNYTTADFAGVGPIRADWDYSTLEIPNDPASGVTSEWSLHAVGDDSVTSKGLIKGYALSRSRPQTQEPNVPIIGGWMTELFDAGEQLEELREDIQGDNDRPPYAVGAQGTSTENYPGGSLESPGLELHSFETVTTTTIGAMTRVQGGVFMCGLIKIDNSTDSEANVIIDLVPGSHKGYLCEEL